MRRKNSSNLLSRVRALAFYIVDVHKNNGQSDIKELKAHIKIMAGEAKDLLAITDRKLNRYVNRTGKNKPGTN